MVTNELLCFSTEGWYYNFQLNDYSICSSIQSLATLGVFRFKCYPSLAVDHNVWLLRFLKSSPSESRFVVQHHLPLDLEIFQQVINSLPEVGVQSHHKGGSAIKTMLLKSVEGVDRSIIIYQRPFLIGKPWAPRANASERRYMHSSQSNWTAKGRKDKTSYKLLCKA